MKNHVLKKEDFKEIFPKIVFFENWKNLIIEIGYVEDKTFKYIKLNLYNGEICNIEGNIYMSTLKKIEILLRKLDIKDLD